MLKKLSSKLAVFAGVFAIVFSLAASAHADTTALTGWGWSSTIGWVSFNSSDAGAGGGPYAVSLSTTTGSTVGTLTGYAWSSNIGWIQFGGLAGTAVNSTTTATDATVDLSTGHVTGWARAVAGVGRTDGWDGWIELSGTNHPTGDTSGNGGITLNPSTGKFNGYAWGGSVVGWLTFAPSLSSAVTACTGTCSGNPTNPGPSQNPIGGSCTVSPSSLPSSGGSVTFTLSALTGGSGTYTNSFVWNGGFGSPATISASNSSNDYPTQGSGRSYTYTYTYPANSGATYQSYSPTVTITDNTGATGTVTCGGFTIPSNTTSIGNPELWLGSNHLTSVTIHKGGSVQVGYTWDTGSLSSCQANIVGISAWDGKAISAPGTATLANLSTLGTYDLQYTCQDGAGINYSSNPVEIDVNPTSIQEI